MSKIKFIGPRADQIQRLGNKIKARSLATKVGIPLLPGSDSTVISKDSDYKKTAEKVGFPLIIKAAAGGGGRGMKIVYNAKELLPQLLLAQKEAQACFRNPDCFIEKYLEAPRHIEVQIIADEYGNIASVGERDCSVQRRYQKLLEEAPCVALTPELRKEVAKLARDLVRETGYQSLGTVEFLYENGKFYFMEMNTRVQVEHPVTEEVTGLDLIKEQIRVASGEKINVDHYPTTLDKHAIECRINAEDPVTFAPWPGKISQYHQPGGPGLRIDSMIYSGYQVPALYDSMIAKVIASGSSRNEAISRMKRALDEIKIDGIRTNIAFHQKILESKKFNSGNATTRFIAELCSK